MLDKAGHSWEVDVYAPGSERIIRFSSVTARCCLPAGSSSSPLRVKASADFVEEKWRGKRVHERRKKSSGADSHTGAAGRAESQMAPTAGDADGRTPARSLVPYCTT